MTTSKKPFVRAEEGPSNSVIYYDEDGNKTIRHWKKREDEPVGQASTRSWRNNNPGNLVIGDFTRRNGAIGLAGSVPGTKSKFAVFPDYATGRKAQAKRLKEGGLYIDSTLNEFVRTQELKLERLTLKKWSTIEKRSDSSQNLIWIERFVL